MLQGRVIQKEILVRAPVEAVWRAWTTSEGVETFFAPEANIELRAGGPYELYFDLSQPEGLRGSEGCRVLGFIPYNALGFTWNNPPHLADIRNSYTTVLMFFEQKSDGVRVALLHKDWPEGEAWDKAFAYFERAWDIVLKRFVESLEKGPVDWKKHD